MADYIRREDALCEVDEWYDLYPDSDVAREALTLSSRGIRKIPAADVVPVRHGKWDYFIDFVTCSLCGYTSTDRDNHGDPVSLNYCPNCGAKMENYRDV